MRAITSLTSEELAALNKKLCIEIQWRQKHNDRLHIVFEEFPKTIATAFSPLIHDHFTTKSPAGSAFVVEGATRQIYHLLFDWMLLCCREHSVGPLAISREEPFRVHLNVYIAADFLKIASVKNDVFAHLTNLANTDFVSAADINELYYYFGKGHAMRKMVVTGAVKCWNTGKFGRLGKTALEWYDAMVDDFEEDVKRHFRREMKDFDPLWERKQKMAMAGGCKPYVRVPPPRLTAESSEEDESDG